MAKIGLVSFEDDVGEDEQQVVNNKKRWSLFKDIRDYATNNKITHIFFPVQHYAIKDTVRKIVFCQMFVILAESLKNLM